MTKKNKDYWKKRIDEIAQRQFDLSNDKMQKQIEQIYKEASKKIQKEVEGLYYKMLDEQLSRSEIWTYARYKQLVERLNIELAKVGIKEVDILNYNLEEALRSIYKDVPLPHVSFGLIDEVAVKQIIARPWSSKHFISTVWDNKNKLSGILKKGITDTIVLGKSKDDLVKTVRNKMQVGFNEADRVVRTELMHTLNAGLTQRYKDSGYKELEILVAEDERTCDICSGKSGEIISVDSYDIPPFHPRCRCTIIPVLDI